MIATSNECNSGFDIINQDLSITHEILKNKGFSFQTGKQSCTETNRKKDVHT